MKILTRIFLTFFSILVVLLFFYHFGPQPPTPLLDTTMPVISGNLHQLDDSIRKAESSPLIKAGDGAGIVWAVKDSCLKTHIALIYLHGFTASHEEGMPVHEAFAKRYGMNLYLSRLSEHGLKGDNSLLNLTADSYYNSAKQALAIGCRLGDSVILMATSAGGALALELAAREKNMPVKALILYSPCIRIFDPNAWVLGGPWSLQLAHQITGGNYLYGARKDSVTSRFWYTRYRIEGAIALEKFVEKSMVMATFAQVHIPVLTCMYYKDEIHQDSTVKISSIRWMVANLGTQAAQKTLVNIPDAGDHVICSSIRSKDVPSVAKASYSFAETILGLRPVSAHPGM